MIDTKELRAVIQKIGLNGVCPAEIIELLDRLEAAESECLEQARLNGMGASREAALMAKLEVAEKEVEIERMRLAACGVAALGYFEGCAEEYISASLNDVLALRAKIEALGKQEPTRDWWDCLIADISAIDCMYRGSPTYAHDAYWMRDHVVWMLKKRRDALPGAKGEEK